MTRALLVAALASLAAQGRGAEPVRGRLWVEWQGPAYHRWAGELRLSGGTIVRARRRNMKDMPGILTGHDERTARWRTAEGYDGGACESVVLDVEAPGSTQVTLATPKGARSAALANLRRKLEVFGDESYLSMELRVLFARRRTERITRLKALRTRTPIVAQGQPQAAIVAADLPVAPTASPAHPGGRSRAHGRGAADGRRAHRSGNP